MGVGIQIRPMKDIAPLNWNDAYNVCDRHFKAMYQVLRIEPMKRHEKQHDNN